MQRAFTLVEILIVVVILGILAGLVVPQFRDVNGEARRTAFVNSARIFVAAAKRYELDYGEYPDAQPGVLPDGFGDYIQSTRWVRETPIGGDWDSITNIAGITAALGVYYPGGDPDHDPATLQLIDDTVDDGDLNTGGFRKIGARRYFFIVAN